MRIIPPCSFPAAVAALLLLLDPAAHAADAVATPTSPGRQGDVLLQTLNGATVPRITLTAKAAERLGIATGEVREMLVARRQMVGGLVVPVGDKAPPPPAGGPSGGFGAAPSANGTAYTRVAAATPPAAASEPAARDRQPVAGEVWVLVTLSPGEYERLAKDRPARLLTLAARADASRTLNAEPTGQPPQEDLKRSMLSIYYKVPGKDHGLALNQRLRVELLLDGTDAAQKTVPYSAVHYDAKGDAWVYVNPAPLSYERQPIVVDRVIGEQALLSQGPSVGTPVVTVGAALLHGTEVFKK